MAFGKNCPDCLETLRELQRTCGSCGYRIELVPEEEDIERYLRRPSLGGLLWTQAYAFGTRQYGWFVLSLIPFVGVVALLVMCIFGRRRSWEIGGWESFEEFRRRQRLMDGFAYVWVAILVGLYLLARYTQL